MNARLKRLILPLLRAAKEGKLPTFRMRSAASQALFLLGKPSLKRKSANQQKKAGRAAARQARNLTAKEIREAVFKRAEHGCEAIYGTEDGDFIRCDANATDLDHWLGGAGRRRQKQSIETCWALCRHCHQMRTTGSVEFWNEIFRRHCEDYGYPMIEHIIHNPVSAAAGGSK